MGLSLMAIECTTCLTESVLYTVLHKLNDWAWANEMWKFHWNNVEDGGSRLAIVPKQLTSRE